ncbi:CoA transferase [Streptomyces dengpaensis]|uniref:CoA transferase n=1 Tax=Streptomyces dengpaensis TaxID=2049881 RepID=UPI00211E941D|nr:CoA transferase [Streptomyces dengpaensis]
MRPCALARLGMNYRAVAARNPCLVYAHAQGFRSDSDQAGNAAYDETLQAASGPAEIASRAPGTPMVLPSSLADKIAGLTILCSVLAALAHRGRTGQGRHIEIPMTETLRAFNLEGHADEPVEGPTGLPPSTLQARRARRTEDGLAA